jgi:hypothetical protein
VSGRLELSVRPISCISKIIAGSNALHSHLVGGLQDDCWWLRKKERTAQLKGTRDLDCGWSSRQDFSVT